MRPSTTREISSRHPPAKRARVSMSSGRVVVSRTCPSWLAERREERRRARAIQLARHVVEKQQRAHAARARRPRRSPRARARARRRGAAPATPARAPGGPRAPATGRRDEARRVADPRARSRVAVLARALRGTQLGIARRASARTRRGEPRPGPDRPMRSNARSAAGRQQLGRTRARFAHREPMAHDERLPVVQVGGRLASRLEHALPGPQRATVAPRASASDAGAAIERHPIEQPPTLGARLPPRARRRPGETRPSAYGTA